MSTIHANTPKDALSRLETMALMAGADLPSAAIVRQIASAIDVIVQVERLRGGQRRIVSIAEVSGLSGGEVETIALFNFQQSGVSPDGQALGVHMATGRSSLFAERFQISGEGLPDSIFEATPATR